MPNISPKVARLYLMQPWKERHHYRKEAATRILFSDTTKKISLKVRYLFVPTCLLLLFKNSLLTFCSSSFLLVITIYYVGDDELKQKIFGFWRTAAHKRRILLLYIPFAIDGESDGSYLDFDTVATVVVVFCLLLVFFCYVLYFELALHSVGSAVVYRWWCTC